MRHIIVGTAGHIDHGKSALVKALTGTDPDRLKEEKLRGITIDLGFAHLDLGDLQVGFVDVPGHERFVKNMLAGVGGIDFVLLVVAADESIMPQTREHFDICRLLGVKTGIVAITKIDLTEPDMIDLVSDEISEMTQGSFLEDASIIPVSSKTGEGIVELKDKIREMAFSMPQRPVDRILRLPIDRAFSIRGFGTVLTGTLTSGSLRKEEEVELIPAGITARVRGIQVHGKIGNMAVAGQRTAVNLQGVDLSHVKRGMVLTVPRRFRATRMLDAHIRLLPSAKPLKNLVKIRFHQGTSEVLARVAFLGQSSLAPGESAYAQLRLDSPVFCLYSDAFIIRQFSPAITIGGGKVLHPSPEKHKGTDKNAVNDLAELARSTATDAIPVFIRSRARRAIDLAELAAISGFPDETLKEACEELSASGQIVLIQAPSPILMNPAILKRLEADTTTMVREFHQQNPLQNGISREELRKKLFDDLSPEVFRYCLDHLVEKKKITLMEEMVSLHGRAVQLSDEGMRVKELIENYFRHTGYQPPALSELPAAIPANAEEVRKISFWMVKQRLLIKISEDLVYHSSTIEEIKRRTRERFGPGVKFGVAEFKELFDLTRKHAIPLLEFLDRDRFTQRLGNDRILRSA